MDNENLQPESLIETIQQVEAPEEKKPADKNKLVALIIGGVAVFIILALVLVIAFTGKGRAVKGSAWDFAPNKPSTMVSFDLDMNMGDLAQTILPYIQQQAAMQNPEAQKILNNLPDLGFLQCSGFVLAGNDGSQQPIVGIRLSNRGNPATGYESFVDKLGTIEGLKSSVDKDGFATFGMGLQPLVTYLDDDFMLISASREDIRQALEIKKGSQESIRANKKWDRIEKKIAGSPLSFYTVFDADGREYMLTGNVYSKNGEVGFKVSWLDGITQVKDILPKDGSLRNIGDILGWQKNLSALIGSTPDSTVKIALPFTFGDGESFAKGESVGFVKLDQQLQPDVIGLKMKGDAAKLKVFLEKTIIGNDKTRKMLADGAYEVTRKPSEPEIPELPKPEKAVPDEKPVNPPTSKPPAEYVPSPSVFGYEMETFYYRFDGDTLTMSNKRDGLKWVSGKTENVEGTILSAIVDGKLIINSLLQQYLSGKSEDIPQLGANFFLVGSLIDKLDPMLHIDVYGEDSDVLMKISVSYNPDFMSR